MYQNSNLKHCDSIPIIDITKTYENVTYRQELAIQIDEICQNIGFFIIISHSIDEKLQNDMMNVSKEFFNLPLSIKQEVIVFLLELNMMDLYVGQQNLVQCL